ncbi:hypothetical protein AVEN_77684-1, partial [Araneus ventricosus]
MSADFEPSVKWYEGRILMAMVVKKVMKKSNLEQLVVKSKRDQIKLPWDPRRGGKQRNQKTG